MLHQQTPEAAEAGTVLRYVPMPQWPELAWLARLEAGAAATVWHGPAVETRPDWFAEAVWAGDFASGDFDTTDLVFGSGGRARGGEVCFVSSGATVDRLHSFTRGRESWVSNSLACLLAALAASVETAYPNYVEDFGSIVGGIRGYQRAIATSVGGVRLTYFDNLRWTGTRLEEIEKPSPPRRLDRFDRYRAFLEAAVAALAANLADPARARPMQMLGTLSSGYDSATIAAVARPHGLREVISFAEARGGESDSGREVADALGLDLTLMRRDAWRALPLIEATFLAADAKGEDVFFAGASERLRGRALLTGFHGDKMWSLRPRDLSDRIVRADQSGLSLSEYRLGAGFIHCPLAFMGVRQIAEVDAASRGEELRPWHVPGDYNRPICRRIVEEAGVPREAFGMRKKAGSVLFSRRDSFLTPASMADYRAWLERHAGDWPRGESPLARERRLAAAHALARAGGAVAGAMTRVHPGPRALLRRAAHKLHRIGHSQPLFTSAFPWALEHAMARYAPPRAG